MRPSNLFSKASIRTATRRRRCDGHRLHWVEVGERFLLVRHHRARQAYCRECAREMVGIVLKELNSLLAFVSNR
jgi:hypothetical protein